MGELYGETPDHLTAPEPALPPDQLAGLEDRAGGSMWGILAGWGVGFLILAGLVTFVLHFSDVEVFLATLKKADPPWLILALVCQAATYCCAAGVWWCVLRRTGTAPSFPGLLRLALVELFANQAFPTGGLSGSIMVIRGLVSRGIDAATAMTALLVAALSYYAAYLLAGIVAFLLLWHVGDLHGVWLSLSIAFVAVILLLGIAILLITRSRGGFIPDAMLDWPPAKRIATILKQVRVDILRDGKVIFQAVGFQGAVFLFDAATLWCAAKAVGMELDIASIFMSFMLASVVATLSPIPLGLGTFEGTCTAMLHLLGGGLEASLAAALILRGFTLWLPMLPGVWLIRQEIKGRRSGAVSSRDTR